MSKIDNELFNNEKEKEQEKSFKEQNIERILAEVFSTDKIEMKTDLNQKQINALTKMIIGGQHFKSDLLLTVADKYMTLLVSKARQGRKEFVAMTNNFNQEEEGNKQADLFKRLVGDV